MKKRIALLVLCAAGMLIVFGLVAFLGYAPHIVVAASSAQVSGAPAQGSNLDAPAPGRLTNSTDDAEDPVLVPVHTGHVCDGESADSTSAGY